MMKLPVTAFLADLKPAVGLQTRQQLMNLDRHTPNKILPAGAVTGNVRQPTTVRTPGHIGFLF